MKKTEKIKLDDLIHTDETGAWIEMREIGIRKKLDRAVINDYAARLEAGERFPEIVVYREGASTHVADGFHRLEATRRLKLVDIEAEVRPGTLRDATWAALGANRAHGHRLTKQDRDMAVNRAILEFPKKTQEEIAQQVGCSVGFVNKIAQIHRENENETVVNARGQKRPVRYAKAEKKRAESVTRDSADPMLGGDGESHPAENPPEDHQELREGDAKDVAGSAAEASGTTDCEPLQNAVQVLTELETHMENILCTVEHGDIANSECVEITALGQRMARRLDAFVARIASETADAC